MGSPANSEGLITSTSFMLEMLFFDRVGRVSYARPRVPLSASYTLKRVVTAVIHVMREYICGRRLEELPGFHEENFILFAAVAGEKSRS